MATPWVEIVDPRSKELMYANIKTGDCSWDPPEGAEIRKMTDDQWWELYDNDCECYYYYCAASQQTVWERPENAEVIPLSKLQSFQDANPRLSQAAPDRREVATEGEVTADQSYVDESRPDSSYAGATYVEESQLPPPTDDVLASNIDDADESTAYNGAETYNDGNTPAGMTEQAQYDPNQYDQSQYDDNQTGYDESGYNAGDTSYDQSQADQSYNQSYDQSQYDQSAGTQYDQSQYNAEQYDESQQQAGYDQGQYDQGQYDQSQQQQAGYDEQEQQQQEQYDQFAQDQQQQYSAEQSVASRTQSYQAGSDAASAAPAAAPPAPPIAPKFPTTIASFDRFDKPKSKRAFFVFKKKVTIENLLSWTKDPITCPMLQTTDKKRRKEAVEMFKQILVYMGDKKTRLKDKERDAVLHDIISKTWVTAPLRDELFVQLCRQTTGNRNKKSLHAGWEIMCTALSFFPPSAKFHSYLEGYVYRHMPSKPVQDLRNASNPVDVFAQYCTKRLGQMRMSGAKKGQKKPSMDEVEHARSLPYNPSMFGDTLKDVFEMQLSNYPDSHVPWILSTLAKAVLGLNAQTTEGIFRVPGDIDEVNNLKLKVDRFELGGDIRDPHIPASLLKLWFRELLDPIIPSELYDRCIRSAGDRSEVLEIVDLLPELNRNVLMFIVHFLQQFTPAQVSAYTKMDVNNLAMVWAPNCLRCPYDDPTVLFENTRKEMTFMRTLVKELDTRHWEGIDM